MTKRVVTAQYDDDIINVAKRLREHNIIAMPVLKGDTVIGIITIENLIDYFLKCEDF